MDFEEHCDVLVAGGGVAGIAAALEAARSGLKTLLVEKTVLLGGLATTGLIDIYLPLCDGYGHQVTYGIAEELLEWSIRYGPGEIPSEWRKDAPAPRGSQKKRYMTRFSPSSFILALDEILEAAGVELMLDTLVCQTVLQGDRIQGLVVENKSGRGVVHASCVVDATGDADVAFRAGAACAEGDNWLSLWAAELSREAILSAEEDSPHSSLYRIAAVGGDAWGKGHPQESPKFNGTDHKQVTRFILEGRRLLRERYRTLGVDRRDLYPICLPAMAQFRTTRRIAGSFTLTDGQGGLRFDDSIGLAGDWRRPAPAWEIPLRTLIPQGVRGLVAAGRCISSEGDAWEVTRVIPVAALTGQAAGIVARLAVKNCLTPDQVRADAVQAELRSLGIPYHLNDLPN